MIPAENASQEPCGDPHPQQNCEGNEGAQSINETPTLSPHSTSISSADTTADITADTTADTTYNDKLARVQTLHARWEYEDNEKEALEGDALQARQRSRCKEFGLIVFGYTLHEGQIDAIHTLYYERRDLLLLAKTGFGKSLIFRLFPFLSAIPGVVLTVMPLKLLQAEQSEKINFLPGGKGFVLNGENNTSNVLAEIANGGYTHIFTSPEIALSKKLVARIFLFNCLLSRLIDF